MLRYLAFLILILPLGGCQTDNSSALDAETFGSAGSGAVKAILNAHCSSCHSYQTLDADGLVAAGLIVKGDPTNSKLYYRLTGSSGANGPKTMPQSGSISSDDVATIQAYITGLQ